MYYCLASLLSPFTSGWETGKVLERKARCELTLFLTPLSWQHLLQLAMGQTDPLAPALPCSCVYSVFQGIYFPGEHDRASEAFSFSQ